MHRDAAPFEVRHFEQRYVMVKIVWEATCGQVWNRFIQNNCDPTEHIQWQNVLTTHNEGMFRKS
jgi:hypothetical protein